MMNFLVHKSKKKSNQCEQDKMSRSMVQTTSNVASTALNFAVSISEIITKLCIVERN